MTSAGEQYAVAWARLGELAAEIADPAWDAPSPCGEWNARQVAGHLVDGERQVRALLEARPPLTPVTDPAVLAELGADPARALRDAAQRVRTTVGALDPDDEAVAALLDGVERLGDRLAATGMYAPALPVRDDASPIERLRAAVGRG